MWDWFDYLIGAVLAIVMIPVAVMVMLISGGMVYGAIHGHLPGWMEDGGHSTVTIQKKG